MFDWLKLPYCYYEYNANVNVHKCLVSDSKSRIWRFSTNTLNVHCDSEHHYYLLCISKIAIFRLEKKPLNRKMFLLTFSVFNPMPKFQNITFVLHFYSAQKCYFFLRSGFDLGLEFLLTSISENYLKTTSRIKGTFLFLTFIGPYFLVGPTHFA